MVSTVTVLAYLLTHGFGHKNCLKLSVHQDKAKTQISWKNVPPESYSLALVIKDLSVKNPKYYGVLYNLPIAARAVALDHREHASSAHWGFNTWGETKFHSVGPKKHLQISLYALDKRFSSNQKITGQWLESHLKGHVIAKTKRVV